MNGFAAEGSSDDPIRNMVESLEKACDQQGLYLRAVSVSQQLPNGQMAPVEFDTIDELTALIRAGVDLKMVASFQIGDLAFSKRVESPDAHEMDVTAQEILPPEHQLLRDNADAAAAGGVDPIDALFGSDDDEDDEGDGLVNA